MRLHWLAAAGLSIVAAVAGAKLPAPTPEEQQAAAAKKAKDAEQLKQALANGLTVLGVDAPERMDARDDDDVA